MNTRYRNLAWTLTMMGFSTAALAGGTTPQQAHPHEPIGFVSGAVVGGFAGGPIGAVIGAGVGVWLGNRVHRAHEASVAEAQVAKLTTDTTQLKAENGALLTQQAGLTASNQTLNTQLDEMGKKVETAQKVTEDASGVLDGLQGDVLFRTGSAEVAPDLAHQLQLIAQAVARAPELKVKVDGYADPRGTDEANMQLSQDRANAVRDLLLSAGVSQEALEINAYGKTQSSASDSDGYALERRVRFTLKMNEASQVARTNE
jgi:sortase system peptidoglycan-associated protein